MVAPKKIDSISQTCGKFWTKYELEYRNKSTVSIFGTIVCVKCCHCARVRRLRPIKLVMDEGGLLHYWGWGLARATVAADAAGLKSTEASERGTRKDGRFPEELPSNAMQTGRRGGGERARTKFLVPYSDNSSILGQISRKTV